jgi:hypothetical protein
MLFKPFVLLLVLTGLPITGFIFSGKSFNIFFEFPPQTLHVIHSGFSWPTFLAGAVVELLCLCVFLFLIIPTSHLKKTYTKNKKSQSFPWWGWFALISLLIFWILAWTRFNWFSDLQTLTFTPIWLSFILLINAHTFYRTGHCLLLTKTRYFISLFILSTLFWWYFEFLNRFVQNWHYIGIDEFSPLAYIIHSTIAFSTVLPAVLSTLEWLQSFTRFQFCQYRHKLTIPKPKLAAWCVLCISSVTLFGIGQWPNYMFPLLWISPLLVIISLQIVLNEQTLFSSLNKGDWRVVYLPALAALICGFFWEMWNFYSAAKWIYFIPFVHAYQIFEMPVLGYLGYLPFGLECIVVVDFFSRIFSPDNNPVTGIDRQKN